MKIELRVCEHCLEGDRAHQPGERKTAVLNDMVACAERIDTYKEILDLEAVHVRKVRDDEAGRPAELPVVTATIQNDQVVLNDTQLVTEGQDGTMLVYVNPADILAVLAGNVDEISKALNEDVSVDISAHGAELLS